MNNVQLICEACILSGVYTPEQIQSLLEEGKKPEVHTKSYWAKIDMKPKENAEGIKCKLWKKQGDKYFLVPVLLYSSEMVEKDA